MSNLRWFRRMVGVVAIALSVMQLSVAQSLLTEPDFSGMYRPGSFHTTIARDSERGWNYIASGFTGARTHINGVQLGTLSRINDRGQVDLGWLTAIDVAPRSIIVLSDGELLVNAGDYSPTWQRLQRGADGIYRLQPFRWTTDAVFQGYGSTPVARDPQGNIYSAFFVPGTATTPLKRTLRRVSPSGAPDANWRLDIGDEPADIGPLAVNADGGVFYTSSHSDASVPGNVVWSLHRVSANDSLRWSQSFTGTPVAIAADAAGRAYLIVRGLGADGQSGSLLRFDAGGSVDPQWSSAFEVASTSTSVATRVVGERLIVIAPRTNAAVTSSVRMVSLLDGSLLAASSIAIGFASFADADGTVVTTDAAGVALFTANPTGFSERHIPFVAGTGPAIAAIARWGDRYVVGGRFEYWYDGIRYANLMRLTSSLKPDPSWQPGVAGAVNSLVVDRDGGVLVGGENLFGPQINLVRFAMNGQRDPRWSQRFDGAVTTLTAAASGVVHAGGRFNSIDGVSRSSIARFQSDGSLDVGWAQRPPWCPQLASSVCSPSFTWVNKIIDSSSGGVLAFWRNARPLSFDDNQYLSRFSPLPDGVSVPISSALNAMDPLSITQDPVSGQLYGVDFATDPTTQRSVSRFVRLLPTTLELDPFWSPLIDRPYVVGYSETHMYLANGRRLTRLANAVANDIAWSLGRVDIAGVAFDTTGERLLLWPTGGSPYAAHTTRQSIELRTAVEYFASNAQRYFITARATEQQQLDALPSQFMRTGMQFTAFDGAVLPPSGLVVEAWQPKPPFDPAGALPVCRFYASPQRGGSNTHFYGRGTDCQFLNTVAGVANEGYDFAALPTKNGLCPVNAPTPVYRLFNDQSARNNGNHRYVVSQARLEEMKARGWLDEGIAFCAVAATDSRAFTQ